jgi:hypothetical protein
VVKGLQPDYSLCQPNYTILSGLEAALRAKIGQFERDLHTRIGGRSVTNLEPEDRSMGIDWKAVVSLFVGLAAVMAIGLKASGEGLGHVARGAEVGPVGCNIGDPPFSCLSPQQGYTAGVMFIWDPH